MEQRIAISAAVIISTLATSASTQPAEEIIERYVEAIGGREAIKSLETLKYIRTVTNTQGGEITHRSHQTIYQMRPCFYRTEDKERGNYSVTDGTQGWRGRTSTNPDSIKWEERSFIPRSPDLDFDRLLGSFIGFAQKGYSVEYMGTYPLGDVQLEVVQVTWKEGHQWNYYFNPTTGLCDGFNPTPDSPGNITHIRDYRRIDGILFPHHNLVIDQQPDGSSIQHERFYSHIELNVKIEENFFRPGGR